MKCYLMGVLCHEIRFALLSGKIFRCITNVDIIYDTFVAKVLRCCESFGILLNRFGIYSFVEAHSAACFIPCLKE